MARVRVQAASVERVFEGNLPLGHSVYAYIRGLNQGDRSLAMPTRPERLAVLVVEDEFLIRMSIVASIEEAGFEVYEAANADQAIRMLETHPDIRALFTDVDMPGSMDGLKLAAAVRRRWPPVKIIVTSGHVKIRPDELPVEGKFFSKPYDAARVVSTLRDLIAA